MEAPEAAIFYGSGSGSAKYEMNGSGSGSGSSNKILEAEAEVEAIKNSRFHITGRLVCRSVISGLFRVFLAY